MLVRELMSTEIIPEKLAIRAAMNPMLRLNEAAPVLSNIPLLCARNKSTRPPTRRARGKWEMKG